MLKTHWEPTDEVKVWVNADARLWRWVELLNLMATAQSQAVSRVEIRPTGVWPHLISYQEY